MGWSRCSTKSINLSLRKGNRIKNKKDKKVKDRGKEKKKITWKEIAWKITIRKDKIT